MTAVSRETARVLAVVNQKGGVGKTTTSVNLAVGLAQLGQRVLCIDLDPQGNASTALGVAHPPGTPSTYDVLIGRRSLADVVVASPEVPGLWVVPSTVDLVGAELELQGLGDRESRLRRAIRQMPDGLDLVLIDCPPSLGLLTLNALVAAPELLIPVQCEFYALEGLGQLTATVERVRSYLNEQLTISTILLTMFDARTRLSEEVASDVRAHFGSVVLETVIPRSVRVSEAPSYGQSVLTYDPTSRGARAYAAAAAEMLRRAGRPVPGAASPQPPSGPQPVASAASQPLHSTESPSDQPASESVHASGPAGAPWPAGAGAIEVATAPAPEPAEGRLG